MEVYFKGRFFKDAKKLPEDVKEEVKRVCFDVFPKISGLQEFNDYPLHKLKGFKLYYRITIKGFRIGFKKTNGQVEFMRVLPRKDIYKFLP